MRRAERASSPEPTRPRLAGADAGPSTPEPRERAAVVHGSPPCPGPAPLEHATSTGARVPRLALGENLRESADVPGSRGEGARDSGDVRRSRIEGAHDSTEIRRSREGEVRSHLDAIFGHVAHQPVRAADGQVYDLSTLVELWLDDLAKNAGAPFRSRFTTQPMSTQVERLDASGSVDLSELLAALPDRTPKTLDLLRVEMQEALEAGHDPMAIFQEHLADSAPRERNLKAEALRRVRIDGLDIPPEFRDDDAVAQRAIDVNPRAYARVSPRLQADGKVALKALAGHGLSLSYAPQRIRAQPDAALAAIHQNRQALQFVDPSLLRNAEFMLRVIREVRCGMQALYYADPALTKRPEIVEAAVRVEGRALAHAPAFQNDPAMVAIAVAQDPSAIEFAGPDARAHETVRRLLPPAPEPSRAIAPETSWSARIRSAVDALLGFGARPTSLSE